MTQKEKLIKILKVLAKDRNIAKGLLEMVRRDAFDNVILGILEQLFYKAYRDANILTGIQKENQNLKNQVSNF